VALARRARVRLYLFHAVHDPQDRLHPTAEFERGGDLTHLTNDAKKRFEGLMRDALVDWEGVVRFGDPVEQTVAFLNGLAPSLLVSASHGVSSFQRLFTGTVVERLTRAVKRPMLVVKPKEGQEDGPFEGFRTLVVSCDGQGHWRRLAPLLPLLDPDSKSRIHMVHALEAPTADARVDTDAASYGQVQQTLQDRLNRQLGEQAQRLFAHVHAHFVVVAPGVPEEMVLRTAREQASDVIVVGVRHSGTVGRWISGSTTEGLLRHASCCVLTLPEPTASTAPAGEDR
jgi:nucleotide-binding universal stress UspA family protein